jgi:hypothetical protein
MKDINDEHNAMILGENAKDSTTSNVRFSVALKMRAE